MAHTSIPTLFLLVAISPLAWGQQDGKREAAGDLRLDNAVLPTVDQMVINAGATDIKDKPAVLTNFLEAGQFKSGWVDSICKEITKIPSDQDKEARSWHYSVQGTHKRAMSLTHSGEYLTLLVTWEPSDKSLLPKFDGMKVDLCKKALEKAADNTTSCSTEPSIPKMSSP
jgi:hypothetical protein